MALAALLLGQLLIAPRLDTNNVELGSIRSGHIVQLQVGRQAREASPLLERGAAAALVQDGGQQAAVHDAGPARGGRAKEDDADALARFLVVPHAVVAANALGAGHGAGRDVLRPVLLRQRLVRVPRLPCRIRAELLDDIQVLRLPVD